MDNEFFRDLSHCLPETARVVFCCRQNILISKIGRFSIIGNDDMFECSFEQFIQLNLTEEDGENIEFLSIRDGDKLLFEAYDGLEYGVYSIDLHPSEEFITKYVDADICAQISYW